MRYKVLSLLISFFLGILAFFISNASKNPLFDPLVVALALGIIVRIFIKEKKEIIPSVRVISSVLIPIGIVFYGAVNLKFARFASVDTNYIFLLFIVFLVYIISGYILSSFFGLNSKIRCLLVAGNTICGASAIVAASQVVEPEPEDVSNSLIPVFAAALVGLFFILPFCRQYFGLLDIEYGVCSGMLVQFTGFVKASVAHMAADVRITAISIKAVRYLGLLLLLPLFATFIKGRFHIPWFLWFFLGAGILFSVHPSLYQSSAKTLKLIQTILWATTMAAIGLNAEAKTLFTKVGVKVFFVSLLSFLLALAFFLIGIKMMVVV